MAKATLQAESACTNIIPIRDGVLVPSKPREEDIWPAATIDPKPDYNGYAKERDCYAIHAFEIEFIGRRSPEGHGHLGLFGSEIWVEKMLTAKPLPGPNCETY